MKRTAVLAVILCAAAALAQSSPFLPQDLYRKLTNEFSGDIAYDHLRSLTQFHSPNGAGGGFKAEAQWILDKARAVGLEDVRLHQLPYEGAA